MKKQSFMYQDDHLGIINNWKQINCGNSSLLQENGEVNFNLYSHWNIM